MSREVSISHYEQKEGRYYQERRPEMQAFVPTDARTILDVGCSEGYFAEDLKKRQACEVWGVEMMPKAAAIAAENVDRIFTAPFTAELDLPAGHFDCVIFNDCLEHMENPETALALTSKLLRPGGTIVASIPNMRYFPVMWQLLVRGNWDYQDSGVMDRTHLRFFTRQSIRKMFERAGYTTLRLEGINRRLWGKGRKFALLNFLSLGRIRDMEFQQFAILAQLPK